MPHRGRPHKGQQHKLHRAGVVGQGHRRQTAGEPPGQVDALPGQQPHRVVQPLGAVVVAGDRQHLDAPRRQLGQKPVQQQHGAGGRLGHVVNVPGHDHGVHAAPGAQVHDLLQNKTLVVQKVKAVDPLAQVQVRQMEKTHGDTP